MRESESRPAQLQRFHGSIASDQELGCAHRPDPGLAGRRPCVRHGL